jgi:hypothetical protein
MPAPVIWRSLATSVAFISIITCVRIKNAAKVQNFFTILLIAYYFYNLWNIVQMDGAIKKNSSGCDLFYFLYLCGVF